MAVTKMYVILVDMLLDIAPDADRTYVTTERKGINDDSS